MKNDPDFYMFDKFHFLHAREVKNFLGFGDITTEKSENYRLFNFHHDPLAQN